MCNNNRLFLYSIFIALCIQLVYSKTKVKYSVDEIKALPPVEEVTDDNFDDLVKNGTWIIKFVAPWCKHCRVLTPEFQLAATKALETDDLSAIKFGSIDITENDELRKRFEVITFPSIFIFYNGIKLKEISSIRDSPTALRFLSIFQRVEQDSRISSNITLEAIKQNLHDPIYHSNMSSPVSAIVFQCAGADINICNEARKTFTLSYLRWYEFHQFIETTNPKVAIPTVTIIYYDKPSVTLHWPFDDDLMHSFLEKYRWPTMLVANMMRLTSMKVSAAKRSGGVVALAVNTNKKRFTTYVDRLIEKQKQSKYKDEFLYCWIDGSFEFRRPLADLGILYLPLTIVFGGHRGQEIWADMKFVNLTRLDDGLKGILDGSIKPLRVIDPKKQMVAGAKIMMQDIRYFMFSSFRNFALVVGMFTTSVFIVFSACHFWILNLKDDEESAVPDTPATATTPDETASTKTTSPTSLIGKTTKQTSSAATVPLKETPIESKKER